MVIKNLTWKRFSPFSLMKYINDVEKSNEMPMYWNMPKPTFQGALGTFKENHQYQNIRSNSVVFLHDILSFSPKDYPHLTTDKVRDLTYKYLETRSPHNPAYAKIHTDKDHIHVHIAISPNAYKHDRVLHLDNKEYRQIRVELETYQQAHYPELENSVVFLKKDKKRDKSMSVNEYEMRKRGAKLTKDDMIQTVRASVNAATSLDEFYSFIIQKEGFEIHRRNGMITGVKYNKKPYRFNKLHISDAELEALRNREQSLINTLLSAQKHKTKTKERSLER